jgi:Tfp pilus assembly protein PilF
MFNMAIKSDPVYIRAYLCRAQAYRIIHDVILAKENEALF